VKAEIQSHQKRPVLKVPWEAAARQSSLSNLITEELTEWRRTITKQHPISQGISLHISPLHDSHTLPGMKFECLVPLTSVCLINSQLLPRRPGRRRPRHVDESGQTLLGETSISPTYPRSRLPVNVTWLHSRGPRSGGLWRHIREFLVTNGFRFLHHELGRSMHTSSGIHRQQSHSPQKRLCPSSSVDRRNPIKVHAGSRDLWLHSNFATKTYCDTADFGTNYANDMGIPGDKVFTGKRWFQVEEIEVFEVSSSTAQLLKPIFHSFIGSLRHKCLPLSRMTI
jgi:hypothetical protein